IGFAFNNDSHHVRIGRMDRDNSETVVTSANWGFGAAISGNMTFYSGITTAYSGQYAAAIGGNAISWASTAVNVTSRARAATDAESGAPLTVYGGVVTVVAGAFPQRDLTVTAGGVQFDVNQARGVDSPFPTVNPLPAGTGIIRPVYPGGFASRIGAQDAVDAAFDPDVTGFGAGIGGAIRQDGGTRNHIFGGEFDITSSTHGAGIGGGGGSDAFLPLLPTPTPGVVGHGTGSTPGAGTWFGTHRVRMNESHTNLTNTGSLISMLFDIVSGEFGAGIGGGGSDGPLLRAGDGGNIFIGGGNFNIKSGEHGAGIGGGGSKHGAGGDGGNVVIAN
ncbi:MAG: hypothetical protein FWD84_07690, partial [Oscillospiraceae bacterium]|nr:hypothetical protein [Oscillospiraceae bacterium]